MLIVNRQLLIVNRQLLIVNCQLLIVNCQLSKSALSSMEMEEAWKEVSQGNFFLSSYLDATGCVHPIRTYKNF